LDGTTVDRHAANIVELPEAGIENCFQALVAFGRRHALCWLNVTCLDIQIAKNVTLEAKREEHVMTTRSWLPAGISHVTIASSRRRHRHIDIYAGMSLCLRRVGGVTTLRVLLGRSRTLEGCNEAHIEELRQKEITRMTEIAKNHNGSAGNMRRL
jgi:hypothetical protein